MKLHSTALQLGLAILVCTFCAGCENREVDTSTRPGKPVKTVSRPGQPDVAYTAKNDAGMNSARNQAQKTLAEFKQALAVPPAGARNFLVKVGFPYANNSREYIWLVNPSFAEGKVSGEVDNEPVHVKSIKLGQNVSAPEQDISDWMYVENGVLRGGYTIRAVLEKLPPDQRAKQLREMDVKLE